MLPGMDRELVAAMAAVSSECSSGCQSGWTTYLDDDLSCGAARFHGKQAQQTYTYRCEYEEEDDLSMVSDASSGPRQQCSGAGNDGDAGARASAERRGRRAEAAAARRQSKKAAVASLLEDTASSSPAFFGYSKAVSSGEANAYGHADAPAMMEIGNAADFSCAFSATTGFKSPLNGAPLGGGYLQMQFPSPPVKPTPTRQVYRDGGEKRWY
ncbi:hypothetical protein ACP4OV_015683 [Aristida adscensionis]